MAAQLRGGTPQPAETRGCPAGPAEVRGPAAGSAGGGSAGGRQAAGPCEVDVRGHAAGPAGAAGPAVGQRGRLSGVAALPWHDMNLHVVHANVKPLDAFLKDVNHGVDRGVGAMVVVQRLAKAVDVPEEDSDLVGKGVLGLHQGERPPFGLPASTAVRRGSKRGAHGGLSRGCRGGRHVPREGWAR